MAKIGWIKPTVTVYLTIVGDPEVDGYLVLSMTGQYIYDNRNRFNYVFKFIGGAPTTADLTTDEYYFDISGEDGVVLYLSTLDLSFDKDGKQIVGGDIPIE